MVIDNDSTDGSVAYLQPKFPEIRFFENKKNTGFGKANNQALSNASGEYILFLNPDTILAEDTLAICLSFLMSNANAGAVGVRMVDGRGEFLKESKRGFPYPWAAFCRMSGLSALFPNSKFFSSYYQGHLPEGQTNKVDVLSGAFMLVKNDILDKIGGFDEQFFMYAEDIDLSYRIQQAGYINYYIADTSIIHFKGESTQKNTRYVKLFYKAMQQFMHKYPGGSPGLFLFFMKISVWLRSKMVALTHLFDKNPQKIKNYKTAFIGNKDDVLHLQPLVETTNRKVVQDINDANEIIFCEGDNFTFKTIIESFRQKNHSSSFKIHASGSFSIVGSDSKDRNGETIAL